MKRGTILALILLATAGWLGAQDRIYDFSLRDVDQNLLSYSELKGEKLTVIDFWATWCQPCVRSMPKLIEMSGDLEPRGVNFIGISVDSPRNSAKVKPFARSLGITYPVLVDPAAELMGELSILAVPTLLLVDDEMNVVYVHEGFNAGDEVEIREEIEKHLARSD